MLGAMGGIVALPLLLMQPLLAAGYLPGIRIVQGQRWHRRLGTLLVLAITAHIIGLYFTSPMDMTDALLLAAPTPFSIYGFIALWSFVATALLVALRSRLRLSYKAWKIAHNALAIVVIYSSVAHALMIEGLMGSKTKLLICISILLVTTIAVLHLRVFRTIWRKTGG